MARDRDRVPALGRIERGIGIERSGIRPVGGIDRGVVGEIVGDKSAAPGPPCAPDDVGLLAEISVRGASADLSRRRDTFEVTAQNNVDHAPDGVRTVKRRGAVGDDLDPVDCGKWNGRDIDPRESGIVGQAVTVEQGQGRIRSQTTQIRARCGIDVAVGEAGARADSGILSTREILRKRADRFAEIYLASFHYGLSIDGNGLADHPCAANARTCDNNGVALRGFRVVGLLVRLGTKRRGKYGERRAREEGRQPP